MNACPHLAKAVIRSTLARCVASGLLFATGGFGVKEALAGGSVLSGTTVLQYREVTMSQLWDGSFASESKRLAPAILPLAKPLREAVADSDDWEAPEEGEQRRLLMQSLLAGSARDVARAAEGQSEPAEAFRLAEPLGASLRDYLAGVVAFRNGNTDEALRYFGASGEGKADKGNPWPLIARFMAARVTEQAGDTRAALTKYRQVIDDARAGQADPLGIAISGLGMIGRIHARNKDWPAATLAYAQQAASNGEGAEASLRWVARAVMKQKGQLPQSLEDPLVLNLLVLYAFTHLPSDTAALEDESPVVERADKVDAPSGKEVMNALEDAVRGSKKDAFRNPDQVAAAAYRHGWYDLAKAFAVISEKPTAYWVRAKLAVRAGNLDEAADALAKAAAGYSERESWNSPMDEPAGTHVRERVNAERGIIALSRGELVDGFELFLRAGAYYWLDIAYLADRVLTTDELGAMVLRLDSIPVAGPRSVNMGEGEWGYALTRDDARRELKRLHGRRLLREGHLDEAMAVFSASPKDAARVGRYVEAMKAAESSEGESKARHLFDAAVVAREDGLSILSYEAAPDFRVFHGNYVWSTALDNFSLLGARRPAEPKESSDNSYDESYYEQLSAVEAWEAANVDAPWWGEVERTRVTDSYDPSQPRYSYRLHAAELAAQAADLLPRSSPQFGQVLCHAAQYVVDAAPQRATGYFKRFQRENEGPAWKGAFGQSCPKVVWTPPPDVGRR